MTGREVVRNKALSGAEVKDLLRRDFERLLANEGLLSHYMAYGRIGWHLRLQLHMENPAFPESEQVIASRPAPVNATDPALIALTSAPLKPHPGATEVASAKELHHQVTSPNAERVLAGMPVAVQSRQQDGTLIDNEVRYPIPDPADAPPQNVEIVDITAKTREQWGLPAVAPATPPAEPELPPAA